MKKPLVIMIVAGEASGDSHAADLVNEIREIEPKTAFFGSAGPKMRAAGVEAIVEADILSVVGISAVARSIPVFLKVMNRLKEAARRRKPDAVILVDFPEFNLKLARSLKKQGMRVIYYISPQIWAWRKYRIRTIRRWVDLVVSILPFEKDWYASQGVDKVIQVGNPLIGKVGSSISKSDFCAKHGLDPDLPIIALLPGSRSKEIARILPEMLEASSRVAETDPTIQFVIALAPNRSVNEVSSAQKKVVTQGKELTAHLTCVQGETYDALNAADAAAVASGTATLEAGILGTPLVVVYKVPKFDYQLFRRFVDVPHIGLINLIAGKRLATELIQDEFTADMLADELRRLLEPKVNIELREKLRRLTEQLQQGNSGLRASDVVLEFVRSKGRPNE